MPSIITHCRIEEEGSVLEIKGFVVVGEEAVKSNRKVKSQASEAIKWCSDAYPDDTYPCRHPYANF